MYGTVPTLILLGAISLPSSALSLARGDDDHEPSIHGLRIGMSAAQVLEVMQRPGDKDEERDGELIIYWVLASKDVLQVHFWKDHVSHLGLQYGAPLPATELGLVAQVDQRSSLDARDPRAQYGYKEAETSDKDRLVWSRTLSSDRGYDLQIQFLSGSRKQFGDQRRQYVQFKYVAVPKSERKKFRKSISG